jgi:hypothetical protein
MYFPSRVNKLNSRNGQSDYERGFGGLRMVTPAFRDLVESFQPGVTSFNRLRCIGAENLWAHVTSLLSAGPLTALIRRNL